MQVRVRMYVFGLFGAYLALLCCRNRKFAIERSVERLKNKRKLHNTEMLKVPLSWVLSCLSVVMNCECKYFSSQVKPEDK